MNETINEVVARVEARATPGMGDIAARVTRRMAWLQGRAARGEDVSRDLEVLRATSANLDEATRNLVAENLQSWFRLLLTIGVGIALK